MQQVNGVYRQADIAGVLGRAGGTEVVPRLDAQLKHLVTLVGGLGPVGVGAFDDDPPNVRKLIEQGLKITQADVLVVNQDPYLCLWQSAPPFGALPSRYQRFA